MDTSPYSLCKTFSGSLLQQLLQAADGMYQPVLTHFFYVNLGPRWGKKDPPYEDHYHLLIQLSGQTWYRMDGQPVYLSPGDFIIGGTGVHIRSGVDSPPPIHVVSLRMVFRHRQTGLSLRINRWLKGHVPDLQSIHGVARRIVDAQESQRLRGILLEELLWRMSDVPHGGAVALPQLAAALQYIQQRSGVDCRAKMLAELTHLSYRQFLRQFQQATGLSPSQYCMEVRMRHAKSLLSKTSQQIQEIATGLGYSDPFFFSRQFRQVVGCSPREYRSQIGATD